MLAIGNWLWQDDGEGGGSWGQPGAVGTLELSSAAMQNAAKPGAPRGVAMFQFGPDADLTDFLNAGGVLLSSEDPRDGKVDGAGLDAILSMVGYRPQGDTWADCLFDLLTNGADPENLDSPGILVPTASRRIELWFAGARYRESAFDFATDPLAPKLTVLLRSQLDAARVASLEGKLIDPITKQVDTEYHLRIADAITEKYAGLNPSRKAELFDELKPDTWDAAEKLLPHNTVITDNFTRANTVGVIGNLLTWSIILNSLDTVSNAVANGGSGTNLDGRGRAESDLSSSDNYSQAALVVGSNTGRGAGISCRNNSSNDECYSVTVFGSAGANVWNLYKVNSAGTKTLIGAGPTATYSTVAKIQASGSTVSIYNNGSSVESVTDSTYTTGTRCGVIVLARNSVDPTRVDGFEAGDLAASLVVFPYTQDQRVPQVGTNVIGY